MVSTQSDDQSPTQRAPRVCDKCIEKKVKCDQKRPTCSRCSKHGDVCLYTTARRKPGPERGSHRTPRPAQRRLSRDNLLSTSRRNGRRRPNETISPARPSTTTPVTPTPTCPRDTNQAPAQLNLTEDQINFLYEVCSGIFKTKLIFSRYSITEFFNTLMDANPIFSHEKFTRDYENCLCSQELISIITAITAKLIGSTLPVDHESPFDIPILDSHIDQLLSSSMLELDLIGDAPSLDHFRKSCILAFYEFHQFPGNQSWMRIGRLTRMAHRIGLDRLEHLRTHYPEWRSLAEEDFREWRSIWWFIYRLDSYSNISSGTPFLIDDRFINTSLVLDPQSTGTQIIHQELFLPPDVSTLWEVIPVVTSNPETCFRNMHIVAIAATRQAGSALRLCSFRLQDEALQRLFGLERQLSALSLALPSGWTNPRRNALLNESRTNHHLRLNTVLLLLMSKLLLSIVTFSRGQESDWLSNWQKIIEICQNIASTAAEWDSSFSLMVDPAVCFIIFAALVFLDIHKKSERSPVSDVQLIESNQTILRLHLDQFARVWTMPRLLSLSFTGFSQSVPGPFSPQDISLVLSRFEAPLHPRWLQFLSSAQEAFSPST